MKPLILLLLLSACVGLQNKDPGFSITFHNDTEDLMCYTLLWVDHGFEQPYPAAMCGGELKPGKDHVVKYNYSPGAWRIRWYQCRVYDGSVTRGWNVDSEVRNILTTPTGDTFK